jgi:hypothetical protein
MQMVKVLAQGRRHKTSEIRSPFIKRTTVVVMEKRTSRRTSASMRPSSEVLVLLVRKAD